MTEPWKTTRGEIAPDGAYVEMRYAEFGAGQAKARSWKLFRDGFQVGYAVNGIDAAGNYRRVLAGFERNPQTGNYEATPRRVPDSCPMCGMDLKVEGYPLGHQSDEGEVCEFRIALDNYGEPLDGQP